MNSSNLNPLRDYKHEDPGEKLKILRHEMLRYIPVIRGYAGILKKIDPETVSGLPDNFYELVDKIAQAGDKLYELLDELTGPA